MVIATGRVISHDQLFGWYVEVIDDSEATGGIIVSYCNADNPAQAFDDWFESLRDLRHQLPKMHTIEWRSGGEFVAD
ncbi:hypothetical protein SH501x_001595 [Pirellulaceae bacterium SH501]